MNQPKSVIDIVHECKIPISSVYRRVRQLEKAGLLVIHDTIISEDGKKYNLYKSNVKSIRVIFGMDSLDIEIISNKDMAKSAYW